MVYIPGASCHVSSGALPPAPLPATVWELSYCVPTAYEYVRLHSGQMHTLLPLNQAWRQGPCMRWPQPSMRSPSPSTMVSRQMQQGSALRLHTCTAQHNTAGSHRCNATATYALEKARDTGIAMLDPPRHMLKIDANQYMCMICMNNLHMAVQ